MKSRFSGKAWEQYHGGGNSNKGGSSHRSEARGRGGKEKCGGGPLNFNTQSLRKWERKANGTFLNGEQNQNGYLRKGQKLSPF